MKSGKLFLNRFTVLMKIFTVLEAMNFQDMEKISLFFDRNTNFFLSLSS